MYSRNRSSSVSRHQIAEAVESDPQGLPRSMTSRTSATHSSRYASTGERLAVSTPRCRVTTRTRRDAFELDPVLLECGEDAVFARCGTGEQEVQAHQGLSRT